MTSLAFEHLVLEVTPFLRPTTDMFVRPSVHIRNQIPMVVYRLDQGLSCKAIDNLYGVGENIFRMYMLIICRIFSFQNGLFGKYIQASTRHRLVDIICMFCDIIGLPNVVGVIDGTHILLSSRSNKVNSYVL